MADERLSRIEAKLNNLEKRRRVLELDIEPNGRISEAFDLLSQEIDSLTEQVNKRFDKIEHSVNQLKASVETIEQKIDQDIKETLALILKRLSGE